MLRRLRDDIGGIGVIICDATPAADAAEFPVAREMSHVGHQAQLPVVLNDSTHDFFGFLANHDFFAIAKGNEGIRGLLDVLNEFGVEQELVPVKTGQFDHAELPS
jgi:hypothetical protein